ncbi:MAG TPA: YCF48-related protein [Fibrobacteria bacterium]|nr:YCF48-related protein [Fibrobacteria bacterium]
MALLLQACLSDSPGTSGQSSGAGFAGFRLTFSGTQQVLLKSAGLDTSFSLDSLILVLHAEGLPDQYHAYALAGVASTGIVEFSPGPFSLAPLRTWTVRIMTIDETPSRRDTVHFDSIDIRINPGDTTYLTRTIPARFSILRVRMVSNSPDSVAGDIRYVRIRLDGSTRDSIGIGPTLRAASFGNSTIGCIVGDSGTVLKTTNGGAHWTTMPAFTTVNLHGVSFPSANTGYAVGESGAIFKTANGTVWSPQASGTSQQLRGVFFTGNSAGYAVGDSGVLLKSNGSTWSNLSPGTDNSLYGIWFTSATTGFAVGEGATILRTTNRGTSWNRATVPTGSKLYAVHFPTSNVGFAVGETGTVLKTSNGGTSWALLTPATGRNLRGLYFSSVSEGWAIGDSGLVLHSIDGGSTWATQNSMTEESLHGIAFTQNEAYASIIGGHGRMLRSSGGSSWTLDAVGTRAFDLLLAYKYLLPISPHTLVLEAMDTLGLPLRGYQRSLSISIGPGVDSTISTIGGLLKCGYAGSSACIP